MRLVFMGTPDFAVPALQALHDAGHEIVAVYTQPPRPAGRGNKLRPSPVHTLADTLGIPVRTPTRLRKDTAGHEAFAALNADAAIVAAYGLILPRPMLDAPKHGCINIHASLLPRWRGASPIHSAILAGDTESGVTIMQMEEGLDTGPMLLEGRVAITPGETTQTLHDRLAPLGGKLVVEALETLPPARPQPETGITYAEKLTRESGRIDWSQPASAVERQVRGLTSWPGTFTTQNGAILKIGRVSLDPTTTDTPPGTVLDDALLIACGPDTEGHGTTLRLDTLQRPGKSMMPRANFLHGSKLPPGTRLGD